MPEPDPVDTVWLRCELRVEGTAGEVAAFAYRARGPGGVPWHFDFEHEEARLISLLAPFGRRGRVLAGVVRKAQEARHGRILSLAAVPGGACGFDLQRLLPVPDRLLHLGADAPESLAWLRGNWGPTEPLRDVEARDVSDRRSKRTSRLSYEMSTADHSPDPAVARLRIEWPDLDFALNLGGCVGLA